jgi:hypothetical protein
VNYKAIPRKAHRKRVIDQTADAAQLIRESGEATSITVKEMPITNKSNTKVKLLSVNSMFPSDVEFLGA